MSASLVLCEVNDGVATLTLNDPAKLNCLSPPMIASLRSELARLHNLPGLRVVVLTGAGEKAFCGGAHVQTLAALDQTSAREFITSLHLVCDAVRKLPVPVIARFDGRCIGAGLELAASCDFRISSDQSRFSMPEVRLGIPSVIEAVLLPGLIGWGRTRLLLYTARAIDAATALSWGLVEEVTTRDTLDAVVQRAVEEILHSDAAVIASQKRLVQGWERMDTHAAIVETIDEFARSWQRPEPRERLQAFVSELEARRLSRSKN